VNFARREERVGVVAVVEVRDLVRRCGEEGVAEGVRSWVSWVVGGSGRVVGGKDWERAGLSGVRLEGWGVEMW